MSAPILIVEDNPDNTKLLEWILEDAGYTFQTCSTAEEALENLGHTEFCLVLMDISLPGMNGKEATIEIRARSRFATLPVVAVTAHATKGEEEAILQSGVTAIVTKPVDETHLLNVVEALLDRKKG